MVQTLQLVNAAVTRIQSVLPATAKIEMHRLDFASFPILGYSLTSNTVPGNRSFGKSPPTISSRA